MPNTIDLLAPRRSRGGLTRLSVLVMTALLLARPALSVELTEFAGAAHGFPALLDANGKKLADGDFSQWLEEGRLRIRIRYEFNRGQVIKERAVFRQKPELVQDEWSWQERRDGKPFRKFAVNFGTKTATAQKDEENDPKHWSEQIEVEPGRTFAGFGFTLALQNLRKRLIAGERIELHAVGFTPKPRVVPVDISYGGVDEMKMSDRRLRGDRFIVHPKIPWIAQLIVHVPDTRIWLTQPPAGFLRWEGPVIEPKDPLIRVDLIPGAASGPANPVKADERD